MEQHNDHKSDSLRKLMDEFQNLLNKLDDNQKDQMFEMIVDPDRLGNLINDNYLGKERPDYQNQLKPVADWLLPLWRLESDSSVGLRPYLEKIAQGAEKKDISSLSDDIYNYCLNLIASFDHHEQQYVWRLWGVLWLLERLSLNNVADIVFLLLRQDYFFVDFYFGGEKMEVAQASLFHFFSNDPGKMFDFLSEKRIVPESRLPVFGAMALTASRNNSNRLNAVSFIIKYLNRVYDVSKQNGNMQNMESYVFMLAHNHVLEALPMLRKIYDDTQFMRLAIADSNDIEEIMNNHSSIVESQDYVNYELCVDKVLDNAGKWEVYLNNDTPYYLND